MFFFNLRQFCNFVLETVGDLESQLAFAGASCLFSSLFFKQSFKKVIAVSLTQVIEVEGVSNRMEKAGLIKVLDYVKQKNLKVEQLTTEHLQIKKYLREQEEGTDHQFDVWHSIKSIKTKLLKALKKKACEELRPWIKSICNQNEMLLKEKWIRLLFHIQNKHYTGQDMLFIINIAMQIYLLKNAVKHSFYLNPSLFLHFKQYFWIKNNTFVF